MDGKELGGTHVGVFSAEIERNYHIDGYGSLGITLRQHYAGLFMANMVSDPRTKGERWDWLAQQSLNAADALLAALSQPATQQGNVDG